MILKWILPKYVHFNGLKVSDAFEVFYHLTIFWLKNAKLKFLKQIRVWALVFFSKWSWVNPGKYRRNLQAHDSQAIVVIWQGLYIQIPAF